MNFIYINILIYNILLLYVSYINKNIQFIFLYQFIRNIYIVNKQIYFIYRVKYFQSEWQLMKDTCIIFIFFSTIEVKQKIYSRSLNYFVYLMHSSVFRSFQSISTSHTIYKTILPTEFSFLVLFPNAPSTPSSTRHTQQHIQHVYLCIISSTHSFLTVRVQRNKYLHSESKEQAVQLSQPAFRAWVQNSFKSSFTGIYSRYGSGGYGSQEVYVPKPTRVQ